MVAARLATLADVTGIVDELVAAEHVAIDTEFHPERRYLPQLYLVQLATPRGAWLFDPLEPEPLLAIGPTLVERPWIVHSGQYDLRLLERALGRVSRTVVDVQIAMGLVSVDYPAPLGSVVAQRLGVTLPKGETLSDWSRRPLSREQLAYAADDVLQLAALWSDLRDALRRLDRVGIAEAAFADAWRAAIEPDSSELWREIGGAATLDAPAAATLRALATWRDSAARFDDQPVRAFVPDGVLLEMARQAPTDPSVLYRDRRLSKSVVKRHGETIVATIAAARGATPPAIARRGTPTWRIATLLESIAEATSAEASWAPRLVAPRSRLEAIAADPPADRAALAIRLGWRDALCGDRLYAGLIGDIAPRCVGGDVRIVDARPGA